MKALLILTLSALTLGLSSCCPRSGAGLNLNIPISIGYRGFNTGYIPDCYRPQRSCRPLPRHCY